MDTKWLISDLSNRHDSAITVVFGSHRSSPLEIAKQQLRRHLNLYIITSLPDSLTHTLNSIKHYPPNDHSGSTGQKPLQQSSSTTIRSSEYCCLLKGSKYILLPLYNYYYYWPHMYQNRNGLGRNHDHSPSRVGTEFAHRQSEEDRSVFQGFPSSTTRRQNLRHQSHLKWTRWWHFLFYST